MSSRLSGTSRIGEPLSFADYAPLFNQCFNGCLRRDAAGWVAQLRDRVEGYEKGTPQFRLGLWRAAFKTSVYPELFEPQEETTWSFPFLGTKEIVVNRACSKSYIAVLPADEKEHVRADVAAIVDRGDGLVWTDKEKGEFEYPYKTTVVIARKK